MLVSLDLLNGLNGQLMNLISALRMISVLIIYYGLLVKANLLLQIHLKLFWIVIKYAENSQFWTELYFTYAYHNRVKKYRLNSDKNGLYNHSGIPELVEVYYAKLEIANQKYNADA